MPKPKEDEDKQDFLSRCIAQVIEEGKPQDQAVAQCINIWEEAK